MKRIPLDSSHQDKSNGSKIVEIGSLDHAPTPIIIKCLWHRNSVNIHARDIKRILFDPSRLDESNSGKIIKIRSLDVELFAISYCYTNFKILDNVVQIEFPFLKACVT